MVGQQHATALFLTYDRGEHRTKHWWGNALAGEELFKKSDGSTFRVGKCSSQLTKTVAERLLNGGIWVDKDLQEIHGKTVFPRYVYNVHAGVPYRAVETDSGALSMHGYPCLREHELSGWLKKRLRLMAEATKDEKKFDAWIANHVKRK